MSEEQAWAQIVELQREINQKLSELLNLIDVDLFDTGTVREYKEDVSNVIIRAQREFNHVCKVYLQKIGQKE